MFTISYTLLAIATLLCFYLGTDKNKTALTIYSVWIIIISLLSLNDFFEDTSAIPPRIAFAVVPTVFFTIFLYRKITTTSIDIKILTALHIIRIPVETNLYQLFLNKKIPVLMTFEGYNFDIISGITALIFCCYFIISKKLISDKILIIWNICGIIMLTIIVSISILSAKTPFQQIAFEQPNIAINEFPNTLLPAVIVPLVLLSHLLALKKLFRKAQ